MSIYEQKFINLFYPTSFPIAIEILKKLSLYVIPTKVGIHPYVIPSPLRGEG